MRVYLIRHASAEDPATRSDAQRALTDRGRAEARETGLAMRDHGAKVGSLLSSPLLRARETAEGIARALETGLKVELRKALACGATVEAFWSLIRAHPASGKDLAMVGHNPDLSVFASGLEGQGVSFRPSTVCCYEVDPAGSRLIWIHHPKS
jgi:phosphohistidine phosphatase